MKPERLTEAAVNEALGTLPGWTVEGNELAKEYRFPAYLDGIEFVRRLAVEAEAMNHHPDLRIGWRRVQVRLTTHSTGGLTNLDLELARRSEKAAGD
ncbi:MAG: 4a-hydroxytetrahydrobiopterin dehydratase [Prosthecobacter sp.]